MQIPMPIIVSAEVLPYLLDLQRKCTGVCGTRQLPAMETGGSVYFPSLCCVEVHSLVHAFIHLLDK